MKCVMQNSQRMLNNTFMSRLIWSFDLDIHQILVIFKYPIKIKRLSYKQNLSNCWVYGLRDFLKCFNIVFFLWLKVPKVDLTLNLHGECNSTLWNSAKSISEALNCSTSCERIECSNAYHDDGSKCGRFYKFILNLQKNK